MNQKLKKNKFIENVDMKYNKQPFYDIDNANSGSNINDILKDTFNSKNKSSLELKDRLDPFDYEINYFNKIKKDLKGQEFIYYSPYDQGPGRGFGNLNINNNIRNSESSRKTNEDFKLFRESEIVDRFDFLDNRFVNVKNIVFPYARTGVQSRKTSDDDKEIDFSSEITDYNFNKPKIEQLIKNKNTNDNLPNDKIVTEIQKKNNIQKTNQQKYISNLEYTQRIIDELKIIYKNNLTKFIISEVLNSNIDPKDITINNMYNLSSLKNNFPINSTQSLNDSDQIDQFSNTLDQNIVNPITSPSQSGQNIVSPIVNPVQSDQYINSPSQSNQYINKPIQSNQYINSPTQSNQYSSNSNQSNQYSSNQNQYSSNQNQYSSNPNQYSSNPNQNQYSSNPNQYSSNPNQYSSNPNQYSSNQNQYSSNQNQYSSNQNQYSSNPNQYSSNSNPNQYSSN
jgi:hypothetical protein